MARNMEKLPIFKIENSTPTNEEEIDETKRKSRNLSEKKRRDQFNKLINELNEVVSLNNRKVDKSTILKAAINNLKLYHQKVVRSKEYEIDEKWKPSFLTNEEYTYLMLQSIGGFIFAFSLCGKILYISSNLAAILGYSLDEILKLNIYNLISSNDQSYLENLFFVSHVGNVYNRNGDNLRTTCQFIKKSDEANSVAYEPVELLGHIKEAREIQSMFPDQGKYQESNKQLIFVGIAKLLNPSFYCEIVLQDCIKNEFTSHHNFEWKFLFLDERAPSIIGYSPFEVLGTSGYDYYHIDDLDNVIAHHKSLMTQDEGVSDYYRFMTKGHQWIWLQTKSYINRRQWNSRIEFVVCTHRVVNPWNTVNDSEIKSKVLDRNPSLSSCSSSSLPSSRNITSPTSWPSTTSDSTCCDDEESIKMCTNGFTEAEDSAYYSRMCNRSENLYKRQKMVRKHRFTKNRNTSAIVSDTNSSCSYSLTTDGVSVTSDDHISQLIFENQLNSERRDSDSLQDTLERKCTELQRIIAERTEELKAVSQQLYIARTNTQQNKECALENVFTNMIDSNSNPILHYFPNDRSTQLQSEIIDEHFCNKGK